MPATDLLSLPTLYNTMQEVDEIAWNNFPSRLKDHPFMYVTKEGSARFSMAVLVPHGNLAFYSCVAANLGQDPAEVIYQRILASKDLGCMVQTFRDAPGVPNTVKVSVQEEGTPVGVVRTTHADDQSEPPIVAPNQLPTPVGMVETDANQAVFHIMLYTKGSGVRLDTAAAANAVFSKHYNDQGQFVEWRLILPIKPGESPNKFEYATLTVNKSIGIQPGEVLRIKVATMAGTPGTGRSYAIQWP